MFSLMMMMMSADARVCVSDAPQVSYEFKSGVVAEDTKVGDPFGSATLEIGGKTVMTWADRYQCMISTMDAECKGYIFFPLKMRTLSHEPTVKKGDRVSWSETIEMSRVNGEPLQADTTSLEITWTCTEDYDPKKHGNL